MGKLIMRLCRRGNDDAGNLRVQSVLNIYDYQTLRDQFGRRGAAFRRRITTNRQRPELAEITDQVFAPVTASNREPVGYARIHQARTMAANQ